MEKGQRNKVLRWILIALGICCGLLGCAFIVFVYLFLFGGLPKVIRDEDKYAETMHKYTQEVVGKVHTGFFVFLRRYLIAHLRAKRNPCFIFGIRIHGMIQHVKCI